MSMSLSHTPSLSHTSSLAHSSARSLADDNPLAWLITHKDRAGMPFIQAHELQAGERLSRDLARASMIQRTTMDWTRGVPMDGGGAGLNPTEAMVQSRQSASQALKAVGPDFSGLLMDVCGYSKGLALIERERQWPARTAKIIVRYALAALARHYGLDAVARGKTAAPMRNWRSA
jgi:hypothetical protein